MDDARRRALIEERDQLLRNLDQLDRELADGDIDEADHRELSEGDSVRLASILRRLDEKPGTPAPEAPAPDRSGRTKLVAAVALLVFSIGAGLLLAQASGERGVQDQITGAIDASSRNKVVECQQLGSTGGDLVGALECFDEVLASDADNAEALSYRGWYLLLAAGSLQEGADSTTDLDEAGELITSGLSYLDRAIAADPTLPDPLAFRASVFDRLGQSELVCRDIATLLSLDPPQFFVDQTAALAARNGC